MPTRTGLKANNSSTPSAKELVISNVRDALSPSIEGIKEFMNSSLSIIERRVVLEQHGLKLLIIAVRANDQKLTKKLLKYKSIQKNAQNHHSLALSCASRYGHIACTKAS